MLSIIHRETFWHMADERGWKKAGLIYMYRIA